MLTESMGWEAGWYPARIRDNGRLKTGSLRAEGVFF